MSARAIIMRLLQVLPLLFLTACSDSSSGGSSISGIVADGYLQGAVVCLDLNNNGRYDEGEPSATTGAGGAFSLDPAGYDADAYPVVVEVGAGLVDEDGGTVAKGYTLRSPAGGYAFVSPLTTLIQAKIDQNPALDTTAAAQIVGLQLNVEDPSKLYADYVEGSGGDEELDGLYKSAQVVARAFGDAHEALADVAGGLETEEEQRAVQVVAGRLLLSRLDQVAVAVQAGGDDDFDPNTAAAGLGVDDEAGGISEEDLSTIAQQITAMDSSGRNGAGAVLPGKTVYGFLEDGTQDGPGGSHTLIMYEQYIFGETSVELADAYDNEIADLDELEMGDGADEFTVNSDSHLLFDGGEMGTPYRLTATATVDLSGITFTLDALAQTKMQDTDLRARTVTFGTGDVMYKIKGVYYPTDIATAAAMLDEEMREEDPDYAVGNTVDDLKTYAANRDATFPISDHGVIIGSKTYLKYFEPFSPGSTEGYLKGVRQGDFTDRITVGTYSIEELPGGRAYIIMDLLGFAEVKGVWDHLLIVNDAQDNHDFEEILISDVAGSKSAEVTYFNRPAMEKIFSVVEANNP